MLKKEMHPIIKLDVFIDYNKTEKLKERNRGTYKGFMGRVKKKSIVLLYTVLFNILFLFMYINK